MRLERLELTGFGRLRDLTLDLSPRVTVVVGANEAGKSTVHRALRAALYGIDAGGQGRPVERSAWSRWMPWSPGPYGLVLTYSLERGERYRVARRLDQREQAVQVQELGGGEVTQSMRVGRNVLPGQVHLGIDEAVFCATCWLGDDALLADPAQAPGQRAVAARLQEALERLADTGRRTTATAAVTRLREAMERVGSERRSTSPLGVASSRLRQLDRDLEAAQRRTAGIARDQARLAELDDQASVAEARRLQCEQRWLLGRLARISVERAQLATATTEAAQLSAELAATRNRAAFPLEEEDRVIALGGELHQAVASAAQASARAEAARAPLTERRQRRAEIAGSLRALGTPISLEDPALEEATVLERAAAAEAGSDRRLEETRRHEAARDQLRRQVAATGLGGVSAGPVEDLLPLFERALQPTGLGARLPAAALALAGAGLGLAAWMSGRATAGLAVWLATAVVATAVAALVFWADAGRRGRHELSRRCPGLDLSPPGLEIVASRLPTLLRLRAELQRLDGAIEVSREELEAARARLAELAARAEELLGRLGLERPPTAERPAEPNGLVEQAGRIGAALERIRKAVAERHCWDRLVEEDSRLATEIAALEDVLREAERRSVLVGELEDRLERILRGAGLQEEGDATQGVAAYRDACATRRRHDSAMARLAEVERRIAAIGSDEATLARRAEDFTLELRERGVQAREIGAAQPMNSAELDLLERQVNSARREAAAASAEATSLRARLGGALEGLPSMPELADERASCAAARERGLRQLAALERAEELIRAASRDVHRDLAPRLSQSVSDRLSLLTEGRYLSANVDAQHFAVSLSSPERCELVPLELVSRGTRDQVSLLLRLALSELLGDSGEPVPLLLDEPLLSADRHRRARALEFLGRLSSSHQVVLTSSDPAVAETLVEQLGEDCGVLSLPPVIREARSYTRR